MEKTVGVWSKKPKIAGLSTSTTKKASIYSKRPATSDLVEAFWLAEFDKIGDHLFSEHTVGWVWHCVENSFFDTDCLYDDFLSNMQFENPSDETWSILTDKRTKSVYTTKAQQVMFKILELMKRGAKFGLSDAQVFRAQWIIGMQNRHIAASTFEFALSLLKQGRRDVKEMAVETWAVHISNLSQKDRELLDKLNGIPGGGMKYEEVLKWGYTKRMEEVFTKVLES